MMNSKTTAKRAPQERSKVMRKQLLDATLDVIHESGWANASTPEICRKAGISRGAQTHHFSSKNNLLIAAIKKVANEHSELILSQIISNDSLGLPMLDYMEILWEGSLDDRFLQCWIEVLVAARTDSKLLESVQNMDKKTLNGMIEVCNVLSDCCEVSSVAKDLIELTIYLLRGMVIQRGIHGQSQNRRLFELWCEMVMTRLGMEQIPSDKKP